MNEGIYEELVTRLVTQKLAQIDRQGFYIHQTKLDKEEAALFLSKHLSQTIKHVLLSIKDKNQIDLQIEIANKIILLLIEELQQKDLENDFIEPGQEPILKAVFSKVDQHFTDINLHLKHITPYTRLTHSELFTGGNVGLSLESELKKEIRSSDEIDLLVSFIKFKGVIILEPDLVEFTRKGGRLRVITTTYMGASDYRAIQLLASLPNTQVKISYNTGSERLHAKAYLFKRNTGFHTAYIGSSNFSRSALTDGLEWNLKITTREVSHIIDKFQKTFDSYWQSEDFEIYDDAQHRQRLMDALKPLQPGHSTALNFGIFDIRPYPFQKEILEKLEVERSVHQRFRNLIVAATGTGKTVICAFDFKEFRKNNPSARLLFLAHRKEILQQAMATFRGILRDHNFGELWVDGMRPTSYEHVFVSVQTLNNQLSNLPLSAEYYQYVVVDECHHLTAESYRGIIQHFRPNILLGLTATPERQDGGNILEDFHQRIAAEIRLPEALNRKLLCPFQYFGISDSVDLSKASWQKGRYIPSELSAIYTSNDRRVGDIIKALEKYTKDSHGVRALGFCVSKEHARYMAEKFLLVGLQADYLTGDHGNQHREEVQQRLRDKVINYLFVVDIYNEGVDIPEVDTVLFLRPTESLTIFLQQLGRGLRLAEDKECLTVLDFVGNSRPEYRFEHKFRALIGKTATTVAKELEDNFPHLPLGCSIVLEKKAAEIILNNIRTATALTVVKLIQRIQQFEHETHLAFNLSNFLEHTGISMQNLYRRGTWKRLCQKAGKAADFDTTNEEVIRKAVANKWLAGNAPAYFAFIGRLAHRGFDIRISEFGERERQMLLMLHYDAWQDAGGFDNLEASIRAIGRNPVLVEEIAELMDYLVDRSDFRELDIELPYPQPLRVHARYTRDQVLAAMGLSTFERKSSNREGVAEIKEKNTELLFVDLKKSAEDFSPTTMYDDYAISETLFHWQSQNGAGPHTPKGQSYIRQRENGKHILLFVREQNEDAYGKTMGYVFLGKAYFQSYQGSKPMSIIWALEEAMPPFMWKDAAKLMVG